MSTSEQSFKDYFSRQSDVYRTSRPGYPDELFSWLASLVPSADTVWDCATGNGQAALSLARFFPNVVATDASEQQIHNAIAHERINYRVAPAENSGLPDNSVDLITVATAAHWFDMEAFGREATRVLKPGGVLALWTYQNPHITPDLNAIVDHYSGEILRDYWPKEVQYVMRRYATLPFPFPPFEPPSTGFKGRARWTLERLATFLLSWSATQNYIAAHNSNPLDNVIPALQEAWGDPDTERDITWDLTVKVGRKPA